MRWTGCMWRGWRRRRRRSSWRRISRTCIPVRPGPGSTSLAGVGSGRCGWGVGDAVGVGVRGGRAGGADADGDLVGAAYLGDALEVRHRLPLLWGRVVSREARVGSVRLVAARTRQLSPEAAAYVDPAMVGVVDGSLPWGRFESLLEGVVVAADPAAAAVREEERARCSSRSGPGPARPGTAGFYVRSTVGVIARIEATVLFVAEALKAFGDAEDLDARKVKAVVVLCNPARAVELLAGYAALRARTVDVELPLEDDPPPDDPADRGPVA